MAKTDDHDRQQARWLPSPQQHDFPAAASYLGMLATAAAVDSLIEPLRAAPVTHLKAKDLLRAAQLPLLPADNVHVASDLRKIAEGQPLSPVLLVRGDLTRGVPAQIADGYHRVCACYLTDENSEVPTVVIDP
ncbi:hypothetical protein [Micropruina sp.]|uniref:hypothetical protein n=1 Tax=Micropruina sp. TaxID=2737536 RepID=UPI0039E434A3